MAELWFHGSNDPDLRITPGGESGGPVDFGALFFLRRYRLASEYIWRREGAVYGYEIDMDRIYSEPPRHFCEERDRTFREFQEEYAAWNLPLNEGDIEYIGDMALWETPTDVDDEERLAEIFGVDPDEAVWTLQKFRLTVARRLGYIGATIEDEHGSVAVLTEYLPERLQKFDHDPEEDEEEDEDEEYSEEERAENLSRAAEALAAAEDAARTANDLAILGHAAIDAGIVTPEDLAAMDEEEEDD